MSDSSVISERAVMARRLNREGLGPTAIARLVGLEIKHRKDMTARKQVIRWITPLTDLGASRLIKRLAGQGKSQREVRRLTGLGYVRFKRLVEEMPDLAWIGPQPKQEQPDLSEQILALAEQDLSMRQAAEALGINREKFRLIAATMPNNPWGPRDIAQAWLHKTGETVAQTARRLADTHTLIQVATLIGYGDGRALRKALIARNAHVKFVVDPRNEARWHRKSA